MRKLKKIIVTFAVLCAGPAVATVAQIGLSVDSVYETSSIVDIELLENDKRMIIAFEDEVVVYSLFPIRRIQKIPVDFLISAIDSGPDGSVYIVGTQSLTDAAKNVLLGLTYGRFMVLKKNFSSAEERYETYFQTFFTKSDLLSDVFFDGDRNLVISDLSSISFIYADIKRFVKGYEVFRLGTGGHQLSCGLSGQVSIIRHREQTFYVASIYGDELIELGAFRPDGWDFRGKCDNAFRTFRTAREKTSLPPYSIHRVFQADQGGSGRTDEEYLASVVYMDDAAKMIATRDLFAIGETIDFSFAKPIFVSELLENFNTQFGKGSLAADESGQLILVSSGLDSRLLKFRVEFNELTFDGWLNVGGPISLVEVGRKGEMVAVVSGNDKEQEIIIFRDIERIEFNASLPAARYSIKWLQSTLLELKFNPGPIDGVMGDKTNHALTKFLGNGDLSTNSDNSIVEKGIERIYQQLPNVAPLPN